MYILHHSSSHTDSLSLYLFSLSNITLFINLFHTLSLLIRNSNILLILCTHSLFLIFPLNIAPHAHSELSLYPCVLSIFISPFPLLPKSAFCQYPLLQSSVLYFIINLYIPYQIHNLFFYDFLHCKVPLF